MPFKGSADPIPPTTNLIFGKKLINLRKEELDQREERDERKEKDGTVPLHLDENSSDEFYSTE